MSLLVYENERKIKKREKNAMIPKIKG